MEKNGKKNGKLANLVKAFGEARQPLILIYGNPDPDALASAWALREVLRASGLSAIIRYTGEVGRLENETMIKDLRIPALPVKPDELEAAERIALVDAQPGFFKDWELPRCDIVLDHHPLNADLPASLAFADLRPGCLATSSILTEYVRASGLRPKRKLATALLYGIQTDGRNLQQPPTETDRAAIDYLTPKADYRLMRRIEFSSYSLGRLNYFSVALIRLRFSHGVLYSNVGTVPYSDVCVQIADFLVRVREAKWAVVCGAVNTQLVIVFRCDGHRKDAGRTAQAAFAEFGSAGGHRTMGRATIEAADLPAGLLLTQNEAVDRFVLQSLASVDKEFEPLHEAFLHGHK